MARDNNSLPYYRNVVFLGQEIAANTDVAVFSNIYILIQNTAVHNAVIANMCTGHQYRIFDDS